MSGSPLWRVGHRADPVAFVPWELCQTSQHFDDAQRRFRTVYCAEQPQTALREVLADFRPSVAAIRDFVRTFGEDAGEDLVAEPVTATWREEHVLAPALVADALAAELLAPSVGLLESIDAHRAKDRWRLGELDVAVIDDLHVVPPRIKEVERAAPLHVQSDLLERRPDAFLVVDDQPEVPCSVGRLGSPGLPAR